MPQELQEDELWMAYAEEFEICESAREHWKVKSLMFLNKLVDRINNPSNEIHNFQKLDVDKWNTKDNDEFRRQSENFDIGNNYEGRSRIGFETFSGDKTCKFYTRVRVWRPKKSKNASLRKPENKIVRQFVEDQKENFSNAQMDPEFDDRFYLAIIDTINEDFNLNTAYQAVEETFSSFENLGKRLDQFYQS